MRSLVNTCTVSTFRRPYHTRLCLEAICRAWRWYPWPDRIFVCLPPVVASVPGVFDAAQGVMDRNRDIPFELLQEPSDVRGPHLAAGWCLDAAFGPGGSDCNLYIEDDVILAVDAFILMDWVQQAVLTGRLSERIVGCTLYHETIPAHYKDRPPDPRLLHLCNGINTCGGTAFFRDPYLNIFKPEWNCKKVEPLGFDYSAHYLMYRHGLYMVYPDWSRSMNCGFTAGSISQPTWAQYFGRSIWIQTPDAARKPEEFKIDVEGADTYPGLIREEWMLKELEYRGLL